MSNAVVDEFSGSKIMMMIMLMMMMMMMMVVVVVVVCVYMSTGEEGG